jgi:uncharacterized membrane protein (DUF373 family)
LYGSRTKGDVRFGASRGEIKSRVAAPNLNVGSELSKIWDIKKMKWELLTHRVVSKVEQITISAMQLLLMLSVATATSVLFFIFARDLITETNKIGSVAELLPSMQQSFAGILIVVLGLELMETLRTYFSERHVRVEVILVVAIIAIGRHVIKVDFEHTSGMVLTGLAALILALVVGYFLVKRTETLPKKAEPASSQERCGQAFTEVPPPSGVRMQAQCRDSTGRTALKIVGKRQIANR